MNPKKYRLRKYIAVFKCRTTPDITLTETICARTKSEAMLFVWFAYTNALTSHGKSLSFSELWELVSLKWKRPVRPFDLSINNQ